MTHKEVGTLGTDSLVVVVVVVVVVVSDTGLRDGMCNHKRTTTMQVTETNYTWTSACALTRGLNSEEEPEKMLRQCSKKAQYRHTHGQPRIVVEIRKDRKLKHQLSILLRLRENGDNTAGCESSATEKMCEIRQRTPRS